MSVTSEIEWTDATWNPVTGCTKISPGCANCYAETFAERFRGVPGHPYEQVFEVMKKADWHQFQILTKRHERLLELSPQLEWAPNIWMGVSVESKDYVHRIDYLRQTGAHIKFLSVEPLLGPIDDMNLEGIDWVIVGGESGRRVRPLQPEWVGLIRDQCQSAGVAFFFKQWGGHNKKKAGRIFEGRTWDDMPSRTR